MGKSASLVIALAGAVALGGCGDPPAWVGTYSASGTWELGGPFEGGRTVGEAAAELLVDEVCSALPAPSFVEDEVRDWLDGSVAGTVQSTVDANLPAELAPDGTLTVLLGQTLAAVQVESTLELDGDDDELKGTETVTALEYVINGQTHRVEASALGADSGITAKWKGEADATTLDIDPHSVALRYGELVQLVAADLLAASELSAIESQLSAALSCTKIVDAMVGSGSGLQVSVAGWKHTIERGELESLCASAMSLAGEKALGQFALDTRVEVGGPVLWTLEPETGGVSLQSGADFGGVVNVVPKAFAPRVDVAFTASSL